MIKKRKKNWRKEPTLLGQAERGEGDKTLGVHGENWLGLNSIDYLHQNTRALGLPIAFGSGRLQFGRGGYLHVGCGVKTE